MKVVCLGKIPFVSALNTEKFKLIKVINMAKFMDIEIENNGIKLQIEQWQGNVAYISNYPGLLDEVKKYLDI